MQWPLLCRALISRLSIDARSGRQSRVVLTPQWQVLSRRKHVFRRWRWQPSPISPGRSRY